jgi:hypothetical protein
VWLIGRAPAFKHEAWVCLFDSSIIKTNPKNSLNVTGSVQCWLCTALVKGKLGCSETRDHPSLPVKDQGVKSLSFAGLTVSVATARLSSCVVKTVVLGGFLFL